MSMRIIPDTNGREVALHLERIELIRKVLDTMAPEEDRTYCWEVHMRCGAVADFKLAKVTPSETMTQFIHRLNQFIE